MSPKSKVRKKKMPNQILSGVRITDQGWTTLAAPLVRRIAWLTDDDDPLHPFALTPEALEDLAQAWVKETAEEMGKEMSAPSVEKVLMMLDATIREGYLREGPTLDGTRSVVLVLVEQGEVRS